MKKKSVLLPVLALALAMPVQAQRETDKLDRGLVAVSTTSGVFVSWRIQSDEYYDVTYNLYRDGSLVAENLTTSNYTDASGSTSSTYQVAPVVRGTEQAKCTAITPWSNKYLEITPQHDSSITSTLVPNDACCVDVDGDGEVEILMKYNNQEEISALYPVAGNNGEYTILEVLKLDGTVLWWVNCGPNMGDFQNNTINIVGYDWDLDGKGEVVMRLSEGATIHLADGTTYVVGSDGANGTSWTNQRISKGSSSTEWFTYYGNEFLFYCNGLTGEPYDVIDYPCARYESGETSLSSAWGDGYGHRSSKYYFGAPYLDGRKPSIFIGRGIYTRHKFAALDVDSDHKLSIRWKWTNNQSTSPWYGQGYHNFGIADVDMDGRDEMIWGSMVIDDNGMGLSTSGLGHGDAQHHGDFNPYVFGLEGFFCNEENPANNYRDLTTSKIYHRYAGGSDDGRAIAGNFCNDYPGAMGFSAHEDAVNLVTGEVQSGMTKNGVGMNFRCYWDGDLQEETYNGGDNTVGYIYKYGSSDALEELTGSLTNNSTKATPCMMGDILGDWREEFITRTSDNKIRIYTTTIETSWRNYSLWYDHQYRNGIVWQSGDYNQPPHASYFLGELEDITVAPPSLSMNGKTEIANGGTISTTDDVVTTVETNDMTVTLASGASPYIYIDNAPTWTQGSAPSEATASSYDITTTTYTHTLTGGNFSGETRLVKQGSGVLVLPATEHSHTGNTDVWEGTLQLDGSLTASPLWLNRHTTLQTTGGTFAKGIAAYYNSTIKIGSSDAASSITTDSLKLGFGAAVEIDVYSDGLAADQINANVITIENKVWPNGGGPTYSTPVFQVVAHAADGEEAIADGKYCIGTVGAVDGDLSDIVIEGLTHQKAELSLESGKLYMSITNYTGEPMTWTGAQGSTWNLDDVANFTNNETGDTIAFVTGSEVTFDDNASTYDVVISGKVSPGAVIFNNTNDYTVSGDSIVGTPTLTKSGTGTTTINNVNYLGNTTISGGTLAVASLANSIGTDVGALGTTSQTITLTDGGTFSPSATMTSEQRITLSGKGTLNIPSGATLTQSANITGSDTLTKAGAGTVQMTATMIPALNVTAGTFNYDNSSASYSKLTTLSGTAAIQGYSFHSAPIKVLSGANASLTLTSEGYTAYTGKLTGDGTLTVTPTNTVNRVRITGNWSSFTGTVKYTNTSIVMPLDNSYGMANATLDVASGAYVSNTAKTFTIGKVTSGIFEHPVSNFQSQSSISGSNTWRFGTSDSSLGDYTFSGKLYDAGGTNKSNFEKIGTNTITLTTAWENSGTVKVSEGTLLVKNAVTLGTGAMTVAADGTLVAISGSTKTVAKRNAMTNSSLTVNGTMQVGTSATATSGWLAIGTTPVTFNSGSTYIIGTGTSSATSSSAGCSTILGDDSESSIVFNDGATIQVFTNSSYTPAATEETPDSFRVFTDVPNITVGDVTFDLPELPNHYYWDTSKFSEGYLYVRYTSSDGIRGITSTSTVNVDVISTSGIVVDHYTTTLDNAKAMLVKSSLPSGIYILRVRDDEGNGGTMSVRK